MDQVLQYTAFAGVDWGGHEHQLCVVDGAGHKQVELKVSHDVAGLEGLVRQLARHGEGVPVAIERAEGLLVELLQEHGHSVFPVSPRISARARERYRVAPVKDDRFDAFVLADKLRHEHGHWRPLAVPSPLLAELRALTRDRGRLLETQQATEAQLRAILESYHPSPARLFSSLDRQIALAFIADYPTPAVASRVRTTRMSGFLRRNGYTAGSLRRSWPNACGRTCCRARLAPSRVRLTRPRRSRIFVMNEALAEFDDAIASVVAEHPDARVFASFPGVGPMLTAVLLAEIGEDRSRYPSAQTLLAESGLAPVTRSSGRSRSVRFRYAANTRLREAAMWWAFNSLKTSPWAAAAFRQARDERGQRYHRALRGLAARWMRVAWRCWQDGVAYDPALHTGAATAERSA